jgi:hypothetical protein
MRQRCLNPKYPRYADHGGRGIKVCDQWASFETFLSDMGERPEGMTLDRIDNDGPYSPENCRWATPSEQARNRRDNRLITLGGKAQCLAAWARELTIPEHVLRHRLNRGWSDDRALTTPVRAYARKAGV